jgi:hypothetical protein
MLFGDNIARLAHAHQMPRYAAPAPQEGQAVMRHFAPVSLAVAPLSLGVFARSTEGALVACTGAAHRLPPRELGALPGAVQVPAIALRADAYLHPAATAMVEPVGCRRLEQPQDPSPTALDSAAARRHKGSAKLPPTALRTEGPGFDANQTTRALAYVRLVPSA